MKLSLGMSKALLLATLIAGLALALPDTSEATTFHEIKKLSASDAEALDKFGYTVAIRGDAVIVGTSSGEAAYIFQRNNGGANEWGEIKKLTGFGAEGGEQFGFSVAVSGDTAIVGAWAENSGAGGNSGAAYVFQRDQGGTNNWGEVTKLIASDSQLQDHFGYSVAISGNTVLVGARQSFVEGNTGAAYVFQRDQGGSDNWGEVTKLTGSDAETDRQFGWSVAVNNDTAIVVALVPGAAYVFQRNQGGTDNWGEVKKLTGSGAQFSDEFGISLALDADTAVVGSWRHDAAGDDAGAAYIFSRDHGGTNNWGEVTKLTASDAEQQDHFGIGVAVSGDRALVGAHEKLGFNVGVAYVYERNEGGVDGWGEVKTLTASDAQTNDAFGWSVALSDDIAVVGAITEDGSGPVGFSSGAAYVFDLQLPKSTPLPPPIGGFALDADLRSLPLETAAPHSAPSTVIVAAIAAAACLVTAGGVAWHARRRRRSP